MQIQPCTFDGWQQSGAPRVRLVRGLAMDREQARLQARAALQACLAPELGCGGDELHLTNQRNQAPRLLRRGQPLAAPHCTLSHAPGLALLAWHWQGPVGVDLQPVDATVPRSELERVARLFFDGKIAQALMSIGLHASFSEAFAATWTRHEARLKCAGLELVEWSAALQAQLADIDSVPVPLAEGYAGAVAWRAEARAPGLPRRTRQG
jgi:4'-phosphopantetheinyl transferase